MFADGWEGVFWKMFGQDSEQRTADDGQIGQQVGIAGAGSILAHQDITPPMIADFDSAPVTTDESQPLIRAVLFGLGAGEVVAGFDRGFTRLFDGPLAAQDDQGSGVGEVSLHRFDGEGVQVTDFDAPVAGVGVGKKGVSFSASKARACRSRLGWLPLIWSR